MTVTSAPPTSDGVVDRTYAKWLMTIMAVGTLTPVVEGLGKSTRRVGLQAVMLIMAGLRNP